MNISKTSPGVGKYKWNKPYKIRGHSKVSTEKTTFADEIHVIGKEIPGPNKYKMNFTTVLSKAPNYSFRKIRKSKERVRQPASFFRNESGILVNPKVGPGFYKR